MFQKLSVWLEQWLSHEENSLLLQGTRVHSPESMADCSQAPATPAPRDMMLLAGTCSHGYTHKHANVHTQMHVIKVFVLR